MKTEVQTPYYWEKKAEEAHAKQDYLEEAECWHNARGASIGHGRAERYRQYRTAALNLARAKSEGK